MKKLFTLTIIFILSAIVLSSCGSKMSLTKRRYTKGYHISKTHKPAETKEHQLAKQTSKNVNQTIQLRSEVTKAESSTISKENKNDVTASAIVKKENKINTNQNNSALAKTLADFSVKKPIKTIDQAIQKHKLSADSDRDGLSLFWIVILVLLILWALGFISGNFGGIINLLLIVALILLILWLLRVL